MKNAPKNAPKKAAAKSTAKSAASASSAPAAAAAPTINPQQVFAGMMLVAAPVGHKTAYEVEYEIRHLGHQTETRCAVMAAAKMSNVVDYVEGKGGNVLSCRAINGGAEFIEI